MASVRVRNIDDETMSTLERLSSQNGRTVEDELREILCRAVDTEEEEPGGARQLQSLSD
jgi:plasmid stability protein